MSFKKIITFFIFLCFFQVVFSHQTFAKKDIELVDWINPTPSFSELNLNIETVANIVGEGQLIISHQPKDIELWTNGEIKHYQDVRFSSAMVVVNAQIDELKKIVSDTENYGNFMPQMRNSTIPLRKKIILWRIIHSNTTWVLFP